MFCFSPLKWLVLVFYTLQVFLFRDAPSSLCTAAVYVIDIAQGNTSDCIARAARLVGVYACVCPSRLRQSEQHGVMYQVYEMIS